MLAATMPWLSFCGASFCGACWACAARKTGRAQMTRNLTDLRRLLSFIRTVSRFGNLAKTRVRSSSLTKPQFSMCVLTALDHVRERSLVGRNPFGRRFAQMNADRGKENEIG